MAQYDLPAMIKYVLHITGQPKLYYIGHSQGTMIGFARFSEDQNLAEKVEYFFALGPVSTVGGMKSPVRLLLPFIRVCYIFSKITFSCP
jgi:pimeloyl-ACP methyl ester carboxylesterase